jgi:hypothetical protein
MAIRRFRRRKKGMKTMPFSPMLQWRRWRIEIRLTRR